MKRMLTTVLLVIAAAHLLPQAAAQDLRRDELILSFALPTEMMFYGSNYYNPYPDLYYSYESRYVDFTPHFFVTGIEYYHFVTERIKLGGSANYYIATEDYYNPVEAEVQGTRYNNIVFLLGQAKYCYKHTDMVQVYSGVGLGATMRLETMKGTRAALKPGFGFEVVPIGVEIGKKFPVYMDIVFGNTVFSYRFGIGYRF